MSDKDDDLDFDKTMKEAEETIAQLDDMLKVQREKMDTLLKKSVVYTILWSVVTAIVFYAWPDSWYYWIPAVLAITTVATLIFILVLRRKMPK